MQLTERQQQIKDDFIRIRQTWAPQWESILRLDCEFLDAYLHLSAVPLRKNHLDAKVKEFIYIAANASSTHLFGPGIQMHLKAALAFGATQDELMEVLELTSTVGIHASNVAFPILLDLLGGRQTARTIHFISASFIVIFVVVHLVMVLITGVWNNVRSMITGRYVIAPAEEKS